MAISEALSSSESHPKLESASDSESFYLSRRLFGLGSSQEEELISGSIPPPTVTLAESEITSLSDGTGFCFHGRNTLLMLSSSVPCDDVFFLFDTLGVGMFDMIFQYLYCNCFNTKIVLLS